MIARLGRAACVLSSALLVACAEPEPESTLDGIYTASQAQRGEALYEQHCSRCHSISEFSGRMFATVWSGTPAAALYLRIANTMPMDQPGSLGSDQVTALMAHIFAVNEMPEGGNELEGDLEWLRDIRITQPGG